MQLTYVPFSSSDADSLGYLLRAHLPQFARRLVSSTRTQPFFSSRSHPRAGGEKSSRRRCPILIPFHARGSILNLLAALIFIYVQSFLLQSASTPVHLVPALLDISLRMPSHSPFFLPAVPIPLLVELLLRPAPCSPGRTAPWCRAQPISSLSSLVPCPATLLQSPGVSLWRVFFSASGSSSPRALCFQRVPWSSRAPLPFVGRELPPAPTRLQPWRLVGCGFSAASIPWSFLLCRVLFFCSAMEVAAPGGRLLS